MSVKCFSTAEAEQGEKTRKTADNSKMADLNEHLAPKYKCSNFDNNKKVISSPGSISFRILSKKRIAAWAIVSEIVIAFCWHE